MKTFLAITTTLLFFCSSPLFSGEKKESTLQIKSLDKKLTKHVRLNYLLFLPKDYSTTKKHYPVILFLHGAGERGNDIELVKKHGPPKIVETKKDFPFIVVSPQSPGFGWDVLALNALLDEVQEKYRVDSDRVYLTGLSMGGYGTWALAAHAPHRFAAIVPICGGGTRVMAYKVSHIPTWVFHGAKDGAVPLSESEHMVKAMRRRGGSPKFTVYPDAQHDSWTETYNNPKLYEWLLQQRRKSSQWKGTWKSSGSDHGGELRCTAVQMNELDWTATFKGFCNRQFIYQIEMKGRLNDQKVRFQGKADLGQKDGGLYQWTGTIHKDDFNGRYQSASGKKGTFEMKKISK